MRLHRASVRVAFPAGGRGPRTFGGMLPAGAGPLSRAAGGCLPIPAGPRTHETAFSPAGGRRRPPVCPAGGMFLNTAAAPRGFRRAGLFFLSCSAGAAARASAQRRMRHRKAAAAARAFPLDLRLTSAACADIVEQSGSFFRSLIYLLYEKAAVFSESSTKREESAWRHFFPTNAPTPSS